MNEPVSNTPELSVTELASALKRTVEDAFGHVRLRGEISGYRGPHGSGHVYFSLKDQNAKIDAIIWKGVFSRIKFRPEDGLEVIATGKISTFPGKSSYQIVIESMEPAGVGALMALLEERKRKLTVEGLFDPARKQLLPYLPRVIGVITSPTGAVIRDVIHRLTDRFPVHVLVWPVRVQGEGSAEEIAAAIRGFNALDASSNLPVPDLLIVARGGGSLEDLWSFNEEIVVRAAAESNIPLISAVGHETDWTLIDHAADIRAPTPTAAAEMAVPVRAELVASVRDRAARLMRASLRMQEQRRRDVAALVRALPSAQSMLETPRQRLDLAALKRDNAIRARLDRGRLALAKLARQLGAQTPEARLARVKAILEGFAKRLPGLGLRILQSNRDKSAHVVTRLKQALSARRALALRDQARHRAELDGISARMLRAKREYLVRQTTKLMAQGQMLAQLGYQNVLKRGFVVVRDDADMPIREAMHVTPGQSLQLEFADGRVEAIARGGHGKDDGGMGEDALRTGETLPPEKPAKSLKPVSTKPSSPSQQGDLF